MTWMWHSMIPEISQNYMFHSSAKEIWDDLQSTFSLKKDFAEWLSFRIRISRNPEWTLDGISNTGSAMTTGKGVHKGANAGGKSFEKVNRGDYCSYCRRSGHTKETCFKLHGRNNVLERMGNNKGSAQ
uniref:Retrotransposon Copia-like N-terminal domain-containing protein n=1 Tax=Cajanus cajan TaxID=3821 RepID=A0A151QWE3_CAJCA|nr:hypothetical protein KK1_044430 [Cajanus cajan]KYP34602.1 hypothetical protein KK1_044437 [Cajanus cajan]